MINALAFLLFRLAVGRVADRVIESSGDFRFWHKADVTVALPDVRC
jgi:hypothetical protein